jgi:Zn-finger nucleic acid-binding protein
VDLLCPKCHNLMRAYERNGVVVDQCTECKGLFLDRGELEKLVTAESAWYGDAGGPARAAAAPPHEDRPPQRRPDDRPPERRGDERRYDDSRHEERRYDDRQYDERRYDDDRHRRYDEPRYDDRNRKKKRRGSFLEDLLDFG